MTALFALKMSVADGEGLAGGRRFVSERGAMNDIN